MRGDAASIDAAQLGAAQRQRAVHRADALLADEQIVDAEPEVVARRIEGAAAARRELGDPGERARGTATNARRSTECAGRWH
jgi:hypothetical protein